MKSLVLVAALLVLGWSLVDMAATGRIRTKGGEVFWQRDEDPLMFWIAWGFFALAFVVVLLSPIGVFG